MTEWEWYDDINVKVLFLHLILTVNFEDKKWRGNLIKRGERVTSLSKLAEETQLSVKQVRLSLEKLEMTGEVARKGTNQFTHLTLVNWDKYQGDDEKGASETANKGQTEGKQRATTKECKEREEDKNSESEAVADAPSIIAGPSPAQMAKTFFDPSNERTELIAALVAKGIPEELVRREIGRFVGYWTELTLNGKKQKWQTQKTFDVRLRLGTWFSRVNGYRPQQNQQETKGIAL